MKIKPVRRSESEWNLMVSNHQIALFYMDYLQQIDEIVLLPDTSQEEVLAVLRLAASHASRYMVRRHRSNGIMNVTYTGKASKFESDERLMDGVIPKQVIALDAMQLIKALHEIGVDVIQAKVTNFKAAVQAAVSDPRLTVPVKFTIGLEGIVGQKVTFSVKEPMKFCAWNNVGKPRPGKGFDLYIVPDYHPEVKDHMKSIGLINGYTAAFIAGDAIKSIYAPRLNGHGGSWTNTNHPFYAEGSEVEMVISPTQALSDKGINEILTVLLALLELENTYLSVSGGFSGSYDLPCNVARRNGLRTSSWNGEARGSEGFCVWAYQVLQTEGKLKQAYVPRWFKSERWLQAYGISETNHS